MSDIRIERARPDEREAVIELANTSYRADNPRETDFEAATPEFYDPTMFRPEKHLVVRDGGRPVAMVVVHPLRFAAGPNVMEVAGIADVCTHPDYRKRGYMTAMMKAAEAEIDQRGFVLGYLGGDRARYARYGWEQSANYWGFELTGKYVADVDTASWSFWGPASLEEWMHEAIESKPFRRTIEFDVMKWAVRRDNMRMLAASGPGGRGLVLHRTGPEPRAKSTIEDWGGSPEAILALLAALAGGAEGGGLSIKTPAVDDPVTRMLRRRAARYGPRTGHALRVCRLDGILRAYLPWLSRAPGVCREGLTLRITDADQEATLAIGDEAALVDGPGRYEVALTRLEMTTFLFGPFPPSRAFDLPGELAGLDAVLPLPVFISGLSNV